VFSFCFCLSFVLLQVPKRYVRRSVWVLRDSILHNPGRNFCLFLRVRNRFEFVGRNYCTCTCNSLESASKQVALRTLRSIVNPLTFCYILQRQRCSVANLTTRRGTDPSGGYRILDRKKHSTHDVHQIFTLYFIRICIVYDHLRSTQLKTRNWCTMINTK
jgi:hypothetical protein